MRRDIDQRLDTSCLSEEWNQSNIPASDWKSKQEIAIKSAYKWLRKHKKMESDIKSAVAKAGGKVTPEQEKMLKLLESKISDDKFSLELAKERHPLIYARVMNEMRNKEKRNSVGGRTCR